MLRIILGINECKTGIFLNNLCIYYIVKMCGFIFNSICKMFEHKMNIKLTKYKLNPN